MRVGSRHAFVVSIAIACLVGAPHGCSAFTSDAVPSGDAGGDSGHAAGDGGGVVACIPHAITEDAGAPDASCGGGPGVVDLSSSSGHCGVCDHSCLDEGCETGQCRVAEIVPLGSVTNNPPGIGALRNGTLYLAQADTIYRAPSAGGAAAVLLQASTLAATSLGPPFIAHQRGWTVADQTKLVSFSLLDGGQPQLEATGNIGALATDGDAVYWAGAVDGQVRAAGNDLPIFADANVQRVLALAADHDGLYLMVQPKAAGTGAKLIFRDASGQAVRELLSDLSPPTQLVIEDGHLYWADTGGAVWRMDKSTLEKQPVTQVPPTRPFVKGLVVDAQSVFVLSTDDGNGGTVQASLHVASKCGGSPRLLRSDSFWGGALLADTHHLYWTHPMAVARMPK